MDNGLISQVSALVSGVASFKKAGLDVTVVCSGAVALGGNN